MRRHPPRPNGPGTRAGLLERLLFRVMGPPQLGDAGAPRTVPRDAAADLCPRCGRQWDDHERVRTASRTYAVCPPSLP